MKVVFYLDCVSPHQVPLAREIVKRVGADSFRYVYRDLVQKARVVLGWQMTAEPEWFIHIGSKPDEAKELLETANVVLTGFRDFDLFSRRAEKGLITFYASERWFKPIGVKFLRWKWYFPGWWRLASRRYRRMVRRLVECARRDAQFRYLAIGQHARKDILGIGMPHDKIVSWAYFVESSALSSKEVNNDGPLRVIWLGRMIDWKHPDTIIEAARRLYDADLDVKFTLVGDGPLKKRLKDAAGDLPVTFMPSQPIDKIREILRAHDVYVLASDAGEGWGAALNEALEEGVYALGTFEAGSSATVLDESDLFHAGDYSSLAQLITRCARAKQAGTLKSQGIGDWTAEKAADRLLALMEEVRK